MFVGDDLFLFAVIVVTGSLLNFIAWGLVCANVASKDARQHRREAVARPGLAQDTLREVCNRGLESQSPRRQGPHAEKNVCMEARAQGGTARRKRVVVCRAEARRAATKGNPTGVPTIR